MSENNEQLDFLAIGDVVTDAFIELDPEYASIDTDHPKKGDQLTMNFGDKLPYKNVVVVPAVGNSSNAAVSAHRLGLHTATYTNVGDDKFGVEQLDTIKSEGISTEFVTVHEGETSNYHYVLRYGPERTILVKHTEFPYSFPKMETGPKFIYLSSLAENSLPFHGEIAEFVASHPETKLVFQPGTFQMKLGKEKLKDIYEATYLFFCNKEEAQRILETEEDDIKTLLHELRAIGPDMPVITDGPDGAYVLDGESVWWGPMYPDPSAPVDRTGAGDSFASTFTSAIMLGLSPADALRWGPINSMNVVQHVGATAGLLTREKLEEYLANAPEDYQSKEM